MGLGAKDGGYLLWFRTMAGVIPDFPPLQKVSRKRPCPLTAALFGVVLRLRVKVVVMLESPFLGETAAKEAVPSDGILVHNKFPESGLDHGGIVNQSSEPQEDAVPENIGKVRVTVERRGL